MIGDRVRMMIFDDDSTRYRGVLHLHSHKSDGALNVEKIIDFYSTRGYDFLAITDHDIVTESQPFAREDFLLISGLEISSKTPTGKDLHLVALNVPVGFKPPERCRAQEAVDMVRAVGGEVVVAHPYWSDLTSQDLLSFSGYMGIEVFNTIAHRGFGKGVSTIHWDEILNAGHNAHGFAVDDAHFLPKYFGGFENDALGGWIMVKAQSLRREDVMDSISKGDFYSSSGPQFLGFKSSNGLFQVRCSAVQSISFVCSPGRRSQRIENRDGELTEAEFNPPGEIRYVRVECQDREGNRAWLNPYFVRSGSGQ